jgi:hypothetical protein
MSNNITYGINSLSEQEIKFILEALLYSSSVDVCSCWYDDNILDMAELSKKIRKMFPTIVLENVFVFDDKSLTKDIHTDQLLEYFPELSKNCKEIMEQL